MKKSILIIVIFGGALSINAQSFCGTDVFLSSLIHEIDSIELHRAQGYSKSQTTFTATIPVVFFIYNFQSFGVNEVQTQLDVLNHHFKHPGGDGDFVEFCLASSMDGKLPYPDYQLVEQFDDVGLFWITDNEMPVIDPLNTQDLDFYILNPTGMYTHDNYLRIYVVDNTMGSISSIIPPSFDPYGSKFVILSPSHTVDNSLDVDLNSGKVLVHEIGHYFGLFHIFEGWCNGSSPYNCTLDGDLICDTPPYNGLGLPNDCNHDVSHECAGSFVYPSTRINHMDYKNDLCRSDFTLDQWDLMIHNLYGYHYILYSDFNIAYTIPYCEEIHCDECGEPESYKTVNYSKNDIVLFPNPVEDMIVLSGKFQDFEPESSYLVKIYDLSGRQLFNEMVTPSNGEVTINVEKLSYGVYSLHLIGGNQNVQVFRFTK